MRRSVPRRIARIVARLIGAVIVLIALAIGFLHTSWGKEVVRSRVEAQLAAQVNGGVTLGSLDYGFLFDGVDLGGLAITGSDGKPALSIASLHVELDRGSLLGDAPVIDKLEITGLAAAIVQTPDGRTNVTGLAKPSTRAPLASIRVASLVVSGSASLVQADGTAIQLTDLAIVGSLTAHPAAEQVDTLLDHVGAKIAITRPGGVTTKVELGVGTVTLGRKPDAVDVDVENVALGALTIESVRGKLALDHGVLAGAQQLAITNARVDHRKLATELGRNLLVDDVQIDTAVTGPASALVIHGAVQTGTTHLDLDGTADVSTPAHPRYKLALVGHGASGDVVPAERAPDMPAISTAMRLTIDGAGVTLADVEAELGLDIDNTKIGEIEVQGVHAKVHANRGAYTIAELSAHGLGFDISGTGDVAPDTTLHARLTVSGNPAQAMTVLQAGGIEIPRKVPRLQRLELVVTASGKVDGVLAVQLEHSKIALAGGTVAVAGEATIDHRVVGDASTTLELHGLDLRQLTVLAGKPPPVIDGAITGRVALTRTAHSRLMDYDVSVAVRQPSLTIVARGRADGVTATTHAQVVRTADRVALATVDATVPIDDHGLVPTRAWKVTADVARRSFAEVAALAPAGVITRPLPEGDVALHAELAGTPAAPRGTIDAAVVASAPELADLGATHVALHATLGAGAGSAGGLAIATTGSVTADALGAAPLAAITGTLALPELFVHGVVDPARLRAGLVVDETIALPDRAIAALPKVPPLLAGLGGVIGGRFTVRGAPPELALAGQLAWHGYHTADGHDGTTTLDVAATPAKLDAKVMYGPLAITIGAVRTGDHLAVTAHTAATDTPLLAVLPALPLFAGDALHGAELGRVRSDLGGTVELTRTPTGVTVDAMAITGSLAITGGVFALPDTDRHWHDIALEVAGDPRGLRLVTFDAHETDVQVADRLLHVSGVVSLDQVHPKAISLALSTRGWLVLSSKSPLLGDAPTGTVDLDARVDVDLAAPVIAVEATIDHLDLRAPDRHDRAHQPETSSVAGDVIFVDNEAAIGRLPVPVRPVVVASAAPTAPDGAATPPPPSKVPPLDVHIHIQNPIHALKAPLDVMALGELAITVRDGVAATRGELTVTSGTLTTFGHAHQLVDGKLSFTAEHPHGNVDLTFERHLPGWSSRDLSDASRNQHIHLTGELTKPTVALSGVANDTLPEVFSMYYAGRPEFVAPPGLPASPTVEVPRGDQLNILAYLSLVIPHLLFLDRVAAWADPTEPRGAYGRIRDVQLDRYTHEQHTRIRAVARPTQPGRSTAEVQWDRLWIHDDHAAFGAGLRAGDRVGGGVGVFFDWSSAE